MQFKKLEKLNSNMPRSPGRVSSGVAALALSVSLLMSGCGISTKSAAKEDAAPRRVDLQVYLDWSISTESEPMKDFTRSLTDNLPRIVEQYSVANFTAFQFGGDGWAPTKIASVDLPAMRQADVGEAGDLIGKVKKEKEAETLNQYRAQVRERLSSISAASLAPPADAPEPACTDLNGVFRRIVAARGKHRQVFMVVTDGHESCSKALRVLSVPSSAIALVVVLLPEKSVGNVSSLKYQQFDQRSAEIAQALPWAVVIPPFEDLSAAIGDAFAKVSDPKQSKPLGAAHASN
jgi:uncharacterized protein YceK